METDFTSWVLRIGRVVNSALTDQTYNCLTQVRILPQMDSFKDSACPVYSPILGNKACKFASEKKDGKTKADLIWCLCSPTLDQGYVLGRAGRLGTNQADEADSFGEFFNFNQFFSNLTELETANVSFSSYDISKIEVDLYVTIDDTKGCMVCHNYEDGDIYIFNSAGGVACFTKECAGVKVGNSKLIVKNGEIDIDADNVIFNAKHISFSKEGRRVLTTSEDIADGALGNMLIPSRVCTA